MTSIWFYSGGPSAGGSEDANEDQGDDGYDDGENERTYVEEDGDSSEGSYYNSDKDSELLEDGDLHGIASCFMDFFFSPYGEFWCFEKG